MANLRGLFSTTGRNGDHHNSFWYKTSNGNDYLSIAETQAYEQDSL